MMDSREGRNHRRRALMKKIVIVSLALGLLAALGAGPAQAYSYTFPNHTLVDAYYHGSPSTYSGWTGWFDVIGEPSLFDTLGADLTTNGHLQIYSNWGPARDGTDGATTADLFLFIGNHQTPDLAVGLDAGRAGKVYINPTISTSTDQFGANNSNYIYGGKYDYNHGLGPKDPLDVPVLATSSPQSSTITVSWGSGASKGAAYMVDIDLMALSAMGIDLGTDWRFVWGSGTCANDTAQGHHVPLPGAFILLGAGLVRLLAYGRQQRAIVGVG